MLTAANLLSLSRIAAAPFLYALIVAGGRDGFILAAALFALASLTDTLDGRLARRRRMVTPLGVYLDTTADKILIAVLLVALAVARQAPGWMAAVIIAREFFVTGLRSYAAALGVVVPAGGWGKAKTLITIVALLFVLLAGDARRGGIAEPPRLQHDRRHPAQHLRLRPGVPRRRVRGNRQSECRDRQRDRDLLSAGRFGGGLALVRRAGIGRRLRLRQLHPGVHRQGCGLARQVSPARPAIDRR